MKRKCVLTGFVLRMEYLEKYGIQLSVFQGHELYEIQSCGMEKYGFLRVLWRFFRPVLLHVSIFVMQDRKFSGILLILIEI